MAGFQYVALDTAVNIGEVDERDKIDIAIFLLRYLGFVISLAGTIICLVVQEYFKTTENETVKMQVKSILKYNNFILLGDVTAFLATVILALTSNLLLWTKSLPIVIPIVLNVITALGALLLLQAFLVIIVKRQEHGRFLYKDPAFIAAKKNKSLCSKTYFQTFLW
jgi:uncharacterized Tic20 family protein